MFARRAASPLVALSFVSSCMALRPIDPNAGSRHAPKKAPTEAAASVDTAVTPAAQVAASPAADTAMPMATAAPAMADTSDESVAKPVVPVAAPIMTPAPAKATPVRQSAPPPMPAIDVQKLTDGNIAAMILALNNTDISYAQLVAAHAQRADVKEFARRMLTDHTGVNRMVNELLVAENVDAEDNEISLDLRDESAGKRDILRELDGFAFDSTYIENEVAYHRKFLQLIDGALQPGADNAQLRGLIAAVRPAVAAHLAHAEQVRANVLSRR